MDKFVLKSNMTPAGDQPEAIKKLVAGRGEVSNSSRCDGFR